MLHLFVARYATSAAWGEGCTAAAIVRFNVLIQSTRDVWGSTDLWLRQDRNSGRTVGVNPVCDNIVPGSAGMRLIGMAPPKARERLSAGTPQDLGPGPRS